MKFDVIAGKIGEFGLYQKRVYFLLCLPALFAGIQTMISVFTLGVPKHRCAIPSLNNDSYEVIDDSHRSLINQSIPISVSFKGQRSYDKCHLIDAGANRSEGSGQHECSMWVYDKEFFDDTVVTKFNLVCEDKLARAHARMILMSGYLLGSVLTGIIADAVGRKMALMLLIVIHSTSSIATAWAPSFIVYVCLRFFTGISNSGLFLVVFVLGVELVGPSKRMLAGIIVEYFWAFGVMILGGVAYALRDWQLLQMTFAFPSIILLSYWWLIPESPRWLMAKRRHEEAETIIRDMARVNQVKLPKSLFKQDDVTGELVSQENLHKVDVWQVFKSPILVFRTVVIFINWFVVSMVFYGLSMNADSLGGNVYVNFELLTFMEVVAYVLCLLFLNRLGRKKVHCTSMLVGGLACIGTLFVNLYGDESLNWINIILALIGKIGAAAGFAVIFFYSAELFPTVLRNSFMGAGSVFARIGGMVSPYIADLGSVVGGNFGPSLPLLICGLASIFAGCAALTLPETLHKDLPETINDAKKFGREPVVKPDSVKEEGREMLPKDVTSQV
ncbi:organic cation transporter protein isoform X1 [Patella vulgata]|uniref:organic cation transporter protein isoform X1 n=2 Tax=Patella vulgata TaxID=6465 RepID=UPI00217F5A2C|nr:organic cation transporter protein isoform X1 [Patella vulgata]